MNHPPLPQQPLGDQPRPRGSILSLSAVQALDSGEVQVTCGGGRWVKEHRGRERTSVAQVQTVSELPSPLEMTPLSLHQADTLVPLFPERSDSQRWPASGSTQGDSKPHTHTAPGVSALHAGSHPLCNAGAGCLAPALPGIAYPQASDPDSLVRGTPVRTGRQKGISGYVFPLAVGVRHTGFGTCGVLQPILVLLLWVPCLTATGSSSSSQLWN